MKINGVEVKGTEFAYEGCHKIYIIEDKEDKKKAMESGYNILPIEELRDIYYESCPLKFISNWKLDKNYVNQGEESVVFSYDE